MYLSLNSKLKELEILGLLTLEVNPDRHYFPGEGRLVYKGKPIEYLTDYIGPAPDGSDLRWREPTDVAWCPAENALIAHAPCYYEPFTPLQEPLKIRKIQ